jgi:hypothetical protein
MAFPAGLSNGQTAVINEVVYVYSATDNAWTRVSTPFGNLSINGTFTANNATFTGNLYANANAIVGNVYLRSLNWSNGTPVSFSTYSNSNVAAYLPVYSGALSAATASIGTGSPNQIGKHSTVDLSGYIQDLRITNGTARYTATFTPPAAAFQTK